MWEPHISSPTGEQMDKTVCLNGIFLSLKGRSLCHKFYNVNEAGRHCAKCNKPVPREIVYGFHSVSYAEQLNSEDQKGD